MSVRAYLADYLSTWPLTGLTRHVCGCETWFNEAIWASVARVRCPLHTLPADE